MYHKSTQPATFIIDPNRDSFLNAMWAILSGTPAIVGTPPAGVFSFPQSESYCRVDAKYGRYTFNATLPISGFFLDYSARVDVVTYTIGSLVGTLNHGAVVGGPFQVAETVTGGTSGATAVVATQAPGYVTVNTITGVFVAGETITGGTSGATSVLSSVVGFAVGSTITGGTSFNTAVVVSDDFAGNLTVSTLSGVFTAAETITSNSTPANSATVATSTTFTIGDVVTGQSSGATGTIVSDTGTQLYVNPSTNFVVGETILDGTTASTATIDTITAANPSVLSGDIIFGLKNLSYLNGAGNSVEHGSIFFEFNQARGELICNSYDRYGNLTAKAVDWQPAWNTVATEFIIEWFEGAVRFGYIDYAQINGLPTDKPFVVIAEAKVNNTTLQSDTPVYEYVGDLPLMPYIKVAGITDTMTMAYILLENMEQNSEMFI